MILVSLSILLSLAAAGLLTRGLLAVLLRLLPRRA